MNVISLPDDLSIENPSPVQVYSYHTFDSTLRSKINLTKNTISFLLDGTKELMTENKAIVVENNKFLIMKSGNCLMTETVSPANKTYKSILLFFTDELLLNLLEKYQCNFHRQQQPTSFLVCQYDNYINYFVRSLENLIKLNNQFKADLLKIKFEEIMVYLIQKEGPVFLSSILTGHDDKKARLINVVENNKLNKLTLQELSFLSNMSLSTFKREFKKQYQESPIKWFQEKRLEHSAFMLSTMKKRPIEIFEEAGYESLSNYIQAFKQKYGVTPKQFQLEK